MLTEATESISQTVAREILDQRLQFSESLRQRLDTSPSEWQVILDILYTNKAELENIYASYPCLFLEAFPNVSVEDYRLLAYCGRIALDYILLYDYLIDRATGTESLPLLASYTYQREYIAALQQRFAHNSEFWQYQAAYEIETIRALLDERKRHRDPFQPYDSACFHQEAIGKAGLNRLTVVGLSLLEPESSLETRLALVKAVECFTFGFQILDDLRDWRSDYRARQFSFALVAALSKLNVTATTPIEDYPTEKAIASVLYLHVFEDYLNLAASSLTETLQLAQAYGPCSRLIKVTQNLLDTISEHRSIISEMRDRAFKRINRTPLQAVFSLADAIQRGTAFLYMSQEKNSGAWLDFGTSAGEAVDWITGYVGSMLASTNLLPDEVQDTAANFLRRTEAAQGGWGYGYRAVRHEDGTLASWCSDADSTSWCVRFLGTLPSHRQYLDGSIQFLLSFQDALTGGFTTYRPCDAETVLSLMKLDIQEDFSGWSSPHPCVTATTLATLQQIGFSLTSDVMHRAMGYMNSIQQDDGSWYAYWWKDAFYTTSHYLSVLSAATESYQSEIERACHWLLSAQNEAGGWGQAPNQPTPWHTALALLGLCPFRALLTDIPNAIGRGVEYLMRQQLEDGSWLGTAVMVLPHLHEKYPWTIEKWPRSIWGNGTARNDHRRNFTTSTVLKALIEARKG
jgi:hypothetical protein